MADYILMNGSSGCLPDNLEEYDTREAAIWGAVELFEDSIQVRELHLMVHDLRDCGIWYFERPREAGAEYVQVQRKEES